MVKNGGIANKKVVGVTTVGGRAVMESFGRLLVAGCLDVNPLLTHRFEGLEKTEDTLYLMRDKPQDLIKPIVTIRW